MKLGYILASTLLLTSIGVSAQSSNSLVVWQIKTEQIAPDEIAIKIYANLAPGWHLYSQFIKEGGPHPTKFRFEEQKDLLLLGNMEEEGDKKEYYHDIYEMDIALFTGTVVFTQRVKTNSFVNSVKGAVEYMTCNSHLCIPGRQEFSVVLDPSKRSP